jgi:hypothetical protein
MRCQVPSWQWKGSRGFTRASTTLSFTPSPSDDLRPLVPIPPVDEPRSDWWKANSRLLLRGGIKRVCVLRAKQEETSP